MGACAKLVTDVPPPQLLMCILICKAPCMVYDITSATMVMTMLMMMMMADDVTIACVQNNAIV